MAKKRKVSNMLGLAVLSTIALKPMHPYQMATAMRERGKDRDMEIKWGSLYTVVQNLEKYGFIEAAETERAGARPERTVYRITEAGRHELTDWVRELIAAPERERPKFKAGLSLLAVLPPAEAIALLQERSAGLEGQIAADEEEQAAYSETLPEIFLIEGDYDLTVRKAELSWTKKLLRRLSDGSFPDLARWQLFHETGQLPPELEE